jgi:hypothetical protein
MACYDVASNICKAGRYSSPRLADIARHVIICSLNPSCLSYMASYDVASNICQTERCCSPRLQTQSESLKTRCLNNTAPYDVAGTICQDLSEGSYTTGDLIPLLPGWA